MRSVSVPPSRQARRWSSLLLAVVAAASVPPAVLAQDEGEPAFRTGEWRFQVVPWRYRRLNGGPLMPRRTTEPHDARGVPMRRLGPNGQLVYNPTVLAQQGMKRLDSWRRSGDRIHLRRARAIASVLEDEAILRGGRRWQPHRYDRHGQGLEAPWVNANSHGLSLSFLSRFHELQGGARRLAAAADLLPAFERRPRHGRWFSLVREGFVWFEHWPGGRQLRVLNAHINAVLGLYDYWLVSGSPRAATYIRGGLETVRRKLHRFRRPGNLSRYSLVEPIFTLHYHRTHIDQLRALGRISGDRWFRRQARLFREDERAWRDRVAATNGS